MKIEAFIASMRKGAREGIKAGSRSILYKRDKTLLNLLKQHSAVDSGFFASNWQVSRLRFGSRNTLAGLTITNDTPYYGKFVAFGAEPGKAPWYYPGGKKVATRKLTLVNGKVWAGGLNPGHKMTVGGPMVQVLADYANKFSQEFANEIVKDIL